MIKITYITAPAYGHIFIQSVLAGGFAAASCAGLCLLSKFTIVKSSLICVFAFSTVGIGILWSHQAIAKGESSIIHRWALSIRRVSIIFAFVVVICAVVFPWSYSEDIEKRGDWSAPIAFKKDMAILWCLVSLLGTSWYADYIRKASGRLNEATPLQIEWRWGLLAIGIAGVTLTAFEFFVYRDNSKSAFTVRLFVESLRIRDTFLAAAAIELVVWYRVVFKKPDRKEILPSGRLEEPTLVVSPVGFKLLKLNHESISNPEPLKGIPNLAELETEACRLDVDILYVALISGPRGIFIPKTGIRISKKEQPGLFESAVARLFSYCCIQEDDVFSLESVATTLDVKNNTLVARRSMINKIFKLTKLESREVLSFSNNIFHSRGFSKLSILMILSPKNIPFSMF